MHTIDQSAGTAWTRWDIGRMATQGPRSVRLGPGSGAGVDAAKRERRYDLLDPQLWTILTRRMTSCAPRRPCIGSTLLRLQPEAVRRRAGPALPHSRRGTGTRPHSTGWSGLAACASTVLYSEVAPSD